jgi:hypothetical protein
VVLFRLEAPRLAGTGDGVATFDVLGWHSPYPTGSLLEYSARRTGPREAWLPAADYYDLLASLPRIDSGEIGRWSPPGVVRALYRWVDGHRRAAGQFPVIHLLEWAD